MALYRKKPITIEARQVGSYMDLQPVAEWVNANGGAMTYGQTDPGPAEGHISTAEGVMTVSVSDFVIREAFPTEDRKFYPCKPDIFRATYEEVEA